MSQVEQARATLADLYRESGKAELIGGRIVPIMPNGRKPNRVAGRISRSLDDYAEETGRGEAYMGSIAYEVCVLPSGRESFSPDASYHVGPFPENPMRFIRGAPTFAVEVRSEKDYTLSAEIEMAEKRADYFAAGTAVVWDVDPVNECVHAYRAAAPTQPTTYRRGQVAEAEPAVPGWRMAVDQIFG
jgi:Uma2 family endonuclease